MALWSLIAPRLSLVWQIALVTLLSFSMGFSLIMGMVFYLEVGLPLLFLVSTTPIMQYRRFYFIHSSSLFLGGF